MSAWADRLRAWRRRMNITQRAAAELLDVSPRTYEGWETGKKAPASAGPITIAIRCLEAHRAGR